MQIRRYWKVFVSTLFPPICASCENALLNQEEFLCATCRFYMPINDCDLSRENEAFNRLKTKAPIEMAAAYLSLSRSSLVQTMIHKLEYRKVQEIGEYLGRCFGQQLLSSSCHSSIDIVVPLPMAAKRRKSTVYNHNESIARGLATALHLPLNIVDLVHLVPAGDHNIQESYFCVQPSSFAGKHILLVDNVLTSGDALASAIRMLTKECTCKVSIATLAIAGA